MLNDHLIHHQALHQAKDLCPTLAILYHEQWELGQDDGNWAILTLRTREIKELLQIYKKYWCNSGHT